MNTTRRLQLLQKNPANIRNICVLAHVDHGQCRVFIADFLLSLFAHHLSAACDRENDSC